MRAKNCNMGFMTVQEARGPVGGGLAMVCVFLSLLRDVERPSEATMSFDETGYTCPILRCLFGWTQVEKVTS